MRKKKKIQKNQKNPAINESPSENITLNGKSNKRQITKKL